MTMRHELRVRSFGRIVFGEDDYPMVVVFPWSVFNSFEVGGRPFEDSTQVMEQLIADKLYDCEEGVNVHHKKVVRNSRGA